jgi:CBS domain-containing protein
MTATAATHTPRTLAATRVADVMTRGVICCRPDTPLREVAAIMARERVHAVYVFVPDGVDAEPRLWGLVSDIDLVAAGRADIDALTARDASVTPLVSVRDDDTLDRAAQLLSENGVSHLAVVDPFSRLPVGVLSTLDVARHLADGVRR